MKQNKVIALEACEQLKNVIAEMAQPEQDTPVNRREMFEIMGRVVEMVNEVYSRCMERDGRIVDAANDWFEKHTERHMPAMDRMQKKAILEAAGIADQFEDEKESMDCQTQYVWAARLPSDQLEKLNTIKIGVK